MKMLRELQLIFTTFRYGKLYEYLGTAFALVYHIIFLGAFFHFGIYPMFFFNIFSVLFFTVLLLLFVNRKKSFLVPFIFFYIEVIVHQILANYYLGEQAAFHYLILMAGFMALFCLLDHLKLSYLFAFISTVLFIVFELAQAYFPAKYEISPLAMILIRSLNIGISCVILTTSMFMYSYIVCTMRNSLETTVAEKSKKLLLMQDHIIVSLASLVDNRDIDTGEHIKRTCAYVELISKEAMKMGFFPGVIDRHFIEVVKQAAPLHDIGKVIVPDNILKKPGKFTDDEFEIMKKHASEGGRIIDDVIGVSDDKYFLKLAKEIAAFHHEKWNGSGYPYGKKGEEIPVSARIMAVADVFDALVSKRCYKEPMSTEQAFRVIEESSGNHFDPKVVQAFVNQKENILKIFEQYKNF